MDEKTPTGHVFDCKGGAGIVLGEDEPNVLECIHCGTKWETNTGAVVGHRICPGPVKH